MMRILGWIGFVLGSFIAVFAGLQMLAAIGGDGYMPGQASTIAIGVALGYVGLRALRASRRQPAAVEPSEE